MNLNGIGDSDNKVHDHNDKAVIMCMHLTQLNVVATTPNSSLHG